MPKTHRPKRGSHGYSPRVRANKPVPRLRSWPVGGEEPTIQGFAGYKAGMTHAMVVDYRPNSLTSGQEVKVPVTVVETPPMKIAAARFYRETPYGVKTVGEVWTSDLDEILRERLTTPKEPKSFDDYDTGNVDDVRVLAYTQPKLVTGVPHKVPELMELRVGGGALDARIALAREKLGQEITIDGFTKPGAMVDVAAVTKGFGFQGSVPRWGVTMQSHKNSKNRRDTSPLGPFQPRFIRGTVPMPGQTGYHNRTEYNKRILTVGENGDEITPSGGFVKYGVVRNPYVLLHGSVPGPAKRLIRFREATRYLRGIDVEAPELSYVSTASKQG